MIRQEQQQILFATRSELFFDKQLGPKDFRSSIRIQFAYEVHLLALGILLPYQVSLSVSISALLTRFAWALCACYWKLVWLHMIKN